MRLTTWVGLMSSLAALGACTPLAWEKPGATPNQAKAQFKECARLAGDEAWRNRWRADWPPDFYDPSYMPTHYGRGDHPFWIGYPDSAELEWDLTNFCMHAKGYRRQPINEAGS